MIAVNLSENRLSLAGVKQLIHTAVYESFMDDPCSLFANRPRTSLVGKIPQCNNREMNVAQLRV